MSRPFSQRRFFLFLPLCRCPSTGLSSCADLIACCALPGVQPRHSVRVQRQLRLPLLLPPPISWLLDLVRHCYRQPHRVTPLALWCLRCGADWHLILSVCAMIDTSLSAQNSGRFWWLCCGVTLMMRTRERERESGKLKRF